MDASHLYNLQDFQHKILESLPLDESSFESVETFLRENGWDSSDNDINLYEANSDDIVSFVEQDETISEFADRITKYLICEVQIPIDWKMLDGYPLFKKLRLWIDSHFVKSHYSIIFFFDDDMFIDMRVVLGIRAI